MSFHMIYKLSLCCIYSSISRFECKIKGGGSDSWLDVRKRGGGVIQMRTVCNRGGGGV